MTTTYGYTGAIQYFTAPVSGMYDITADGAQGGAGNAGAGGLGASITGDIYLAAGAELEIIVGGEGSAVNPGSATFGGGGGGGGGTFVIETSTIGHLLFNTDEIIAGGGGGSGNLASAGGGGGLAGATGGHGAVGGEGGSSVEDGGGGGGGGGFTGGVGGYTGGGAGTGGGGHGLILGATFVGGLPGGGASGGTGGSGGYGGGGGGGGGHGAAGGGGGGYTGGGGGLGDHGFNGGGGAGGGSYFNASTTTDGSKSYINVETNAQSGVHAGNGEVTISLVVCFVSGARILTTRGQVAVENLAVGDRVLTASGEARPITWIGHRRLKRPARAQWPVRVMAGAFGEGLPKRELLLSPGHAVCVRLVDEVFIPVGKLINGATIARVEVPEVTYWHVELESHDVLLAEGLPCESYMDAGNRAWFGREYGRLETIDPERAAKSLSRYARPFVNDGPVVEAIRERLAARAEDLGWIQTHDLDLHLIVDGERVTPEVDGDLARFVFPARASAIRLCSKTFVPAEQGATRDHRVLGTQVNAVSISDGLRSSYEVPLDEIAGFHPEEAADAVAWRWTDGDLALPATLWADCRGLAILRLALDPGAVSRWIEPEERIAGRRAAT